MMSAKTVLTDSPATTAAATPTNTATPTAPGATPSEFQNLLTAANPPVVPQTIELAFMDTLPTQPPSQTIAQLLGSKPVPARPVPVPAQPAAAATVATKPVAAGELLQLLTESAALLPETSDTVCAAPDELPDDSGEELLETTSDDDDILSDWLDAMVPYGVFASQAGSEKAGSGQAGEAPDKQGVGHEGKPVAVPISLVPQALVAESGGENAAVATPSVPTTASTAREAAAVAVSTVAQTVAAAVIAPKQDTAERDKPANDWMNALGDLTTKRGHDAVPVPQARIATPVHDARWADALAHRLVMMARDGESVAQLKLVPQDLGPLDIQISVRDSEASVHFGAANAETRAVLESSLPRLRELLSAQGLQLANASVSQHSAGQNRSERAAGTPAVGAVTEEPTAAEAKAVSTALLDIYA